MEARQRLDRLHLDDDRVSNNEIETKSGIQRHAFVGHGKGHLPVNRNSTELKLVRDAAFVHGLKQARPK